MADDTRRATEANRLYWETPTAVASIAERLDLSRRALYEAVQPLRAGATCARCGTDLEYGNRTARNAHDATCPACGNEQHVGADRGPATATRGERGREAEPVSTRTLMIGGTAIAGAAFGAAVALMLSRRR